MTPNGHSVTKGRTVRFPATVKNTGETMFRDVVAIAEWSDGEKVSLGIGEVLANTMASPVVDRSDGPELPEIPSWRIEYTDVHGLRWQHRSNGELTRLAGGDDEP